MQIKVRAEFKSYPFSICKVQKPTVHKVQGRTLHKIEWDKPIGHRNNDSCSVNLKVKSAKKASARLEMNRREVRHMLY